MIVDQMPAKECDQLALVVRRPFALVPLAIAFGRLGRPLVVAPADVDVVTGLLRQQLAQRSTPSKPAASAPVAPASTRSSAGRSRSSTRTCNVVRCWSAARNARCRPSSR